MPETHETDEELYIRYLEKRDKDAFRDLFLRHRENLTLFLFSIVHNAEDAEELMLDAYAEAAVREYWKKEGASFKTWLYGVGRNLAYTFLRKKRRTEELKDENASQALPEEDLFKKERDRQLYAALSRIPYDYRQTLHLLYIEDMSVEEAAAVMKKNRKQIYNLAARGKTALKEELIRNGFDVLSI